MKYGSVVDYPPTTAAAIELHDNTNSCGAVGGPATLNSKNQRFSFPTAEEDAGRGCREKTLEKDVLKTRRGGQMVDGCKKTAVATEEPSKDDETREGVCCRCGTGLGFE